MFAFSPAHFFSTRLHMRKVLIFLLACISSVAAAQQPRIDASSPKALERSYAKVIENLDDEAQQRFAVAMTTIGVVMAQRPDLGGSAKIKDMIDGNPLLKHVYIMGVPEDKASAIPEVYRNKVEVLTDKRLHAHSALNLPLPADGPLYVSIDKDVLDTNSARTDWDQGCLTLDDLKRVLTLVMRHEEVVGVDVCGECPATLRLFDPDGSLTIDDKANRELLELFMRQGLC